MILLSLIVRVGICIALFVGLILPLGSVFSIWFPDFPNYSQFASALNSFIGTLSNVFLNIKGAINYFISRSMGDTVVLIYNTLIKVSFLYPVFGLTSKLAFAIYYYVL